jgi:preprotein translocase subunit SecA
MLEFITKIFGTKHDRDIKKISPWVDQINGFFDQLSSLTEDH